jgi:hypothetical protein
MKVNYITLLSAVLFIASFSRCEDQCKATNKYSYFEPVYMTSAQLKAQVEFQPPHELTDIGRIYFKDDYLFLNEKGKGIHVYNNENPSHPKSIGFLNIPGNYDLAISGSTLYADSYVDLIVFDISDFNNIKEVNRMESLFNNYQSMGMQVASEKGIIVDWQEKENVQVYETECDQQNYWGGIYYEDGIALSSSAAANFSGKVTPRPSSSSTGIGGSMARFTVNNNYLYALDGANLDIVQISIPQQPKAEKQVPLTWNVETIFPAGDNLFFGTQTGLLIYNVVDPSSPSFVSQYAHVRSCDPVVIEDNYAYVTLRSGSTCEGFTNQLEVIDITDLKSPVLVSTCPMTNPYGVGIDDKVLFVCDGSSGLRVLDATDVTAVCNKQIYQYDKIHALDIIPFNKIAMVISENGLYQYDYSDPSAIRLLSTLTVLQ